MPAEQKFKLKLETSFIILRIADNKEMLVKQKAMARLHGNYTRECKRNKEQANITIKL